MEQLLDPILLSRIQFAFVVSFHAIFPVFSIGIASFVALLEALYYKTGDEAYARLSAFWTKVFAIAFGMGVVSGIVMSFQFGTNWSNFAYATANFLGPVLSYEVVTAFFLEAAFLGVLLFGRDKVPAGVHLFLHVWSRSVHSSRHSGSLRPTHGCIHQRASSSSTECFMSLTGLRQSSIRRFHTDLHTWVLRRF